MTRKALSWDQIIERRAKDDPRLKELLQAIHSRAKSNKGAKALKAEIDALRFALVAAWIFLDSKKKAQRALHEGFAN